MRLLVYCAVPLLLAALAAGCGGEVDKKGINKDKDRPAPPPRVEAPAKAVPEVAALPPPRGRE
jgi:hypothetical protein